MKNGLKIGLLVVLIVIGALLAVSCSSDEVTAISLNASDMPRQTYVQGQDIDLSSGTLKVEKGGERVELPLNAQGVTVSGYDKNTLGEQEIRIEYEGVSTVMTVTVVARVSVSGATVDYLVGDEIDVSKGRVTVTLDDGTTETFNLRSGDVTVSGFDSSSAKTGMPLYVSCKVGETTYEGSYAVNVHAIESVDFHRPNRVTYDSHYTGEVDITGGYFILKAKGGALKRTVNVTADMVSGFDIGAVNSQNSPLTQNIKVTYGGVDYSYEVKLTYTDVSMFLDSADAFAAIDWNGESEPEISEELGELALTLMEAFVKMPTAKRELVGEENAYNIARAAIVYGFERWADNIKLFKGAFAIEYGEMVLYCESYEKIENAISLLKNKDSAIYTVAPLLLNIIEIYGDSVVYQNETTLIRFNSYPVISEDALAVISDMFEHILEVFDAIDTVPDTWDADVLNAHASAIEGAYVNMMSSNYVSAFPRLYALISDWRANDDLFDIIYSHFYYNKESEYAMKNLIAFGLPKRLESLYTYATDAMVMMNTLESLEYRDTTGLFYSYWQAMAIADAIKAEEGSMENYVYRNASLNKILGISSTATVGFEDVLEYVRISPFGIYDSYSAVLGVDKCEAVIEAYVQIIHKLETVNGYAATLEYDASVQALFDAFVALSPAEQYNLLAAFNSLYKLGIPELAFDDSEENRGSVSYFNVLINDFMRSKLSEKEADTYNDLILAIEVYANRFVYADWKADFVLRMDKVSSAVEALAGSDKESFKNHLMTAYEKYNAIRKSLDESTVVDLGDLKERFEELDRAMLDLQTAYYLTYTLKYDMHNYFIASFERVNSISQFILKSASADILFAYYNSPMFMVSAPNSETNTAAVYQTYDQAIGYYRAFYIEMLVFFGGSQNIYDVYTEKKMGNFFNSYYDIVSVFVNRAEGEEPVFNRAKALAAMKNFRLLDAETKALFILMEGDVNVYYTAISSFVTSAFTDKAAAVAAKLYALEQYCYNYELVPNDVTLNTIKANLEQMEALYKALEGEDKASFADLEAAYLYYVELSKSIISGGGTGSTEA